MVNTLTQRGLLKIYSIKTFKRAPATTSLPQEVSVQLNGTQIRFIDTPGFSYEKAPLEEADLNSVRARDILLRNRGKIERIKNTDAVGECS